MAELVTGYIFDIHQFADEMQVWLKQDNGQVNVFYDSFYPEIFMEGNPKTMLAFLKRLQQLDALLLPPQRVQKRDFYSGKPIDALQLTLAKPEVLQKIRNKLYHFYGKLNIYHADFDATVNYMLRKKIFPLAKVQLEFTTEGSRKKVAHFTLQDDIENYEYTLPEFRIAHISLKLSHRFPLEKGNTLIFRCGERQHEISFLPPVKGLHTLNQLLVQYNPDIIISEHGDLSILPSLFSLSQKFKLPLQLDRPGAPAVTRNLSRGGKSFNSYGNVVFRAISYPLFGRWHIDAGNSFIYKEAALPGLLEIARLSRMPVQRLARTSTGQALTNLETEQALKLGYLVPWQKSRLENPKTAAQLLRNDKGGLTFLPNISHGRIYAPAVQIDFAQMYPTIMVKHNISPETVNCPCCATSPTAAKVPEIDYHTCEKRRGIVSLALENILERRKYLKACKQNAKKSHNEILLKVYDSRQSALKWMLVTSFGYLGYRNAKFGKLESHEAVTAFGRDKLLSAKEIAEQKGFSVIHALTDCLFLYREGEEQNSPDWLEKYVLALCSEISIATSVEMSLEGIYSWLYFPPSKQKERLPVPTRYLGRLADGTMKFRGIAARRKDTPEFIREFQLNLLQQMQVFEDAESLKELHPHFVAQYKTAVHLLREKKVDFRKLLVRKTVTRNFYDYQTKGAAYHSLAQLNAMQIQVQPGEKVKYIIAGTYRKPVYLSEEWVQKNNHTAYCPMKYIEMLYDAFEEVWAPFAPAYFRGNSPLQGELEM